ncbi:MAG: hypothetical protein ACK4WB_07840 [Desulfatiglandales bacterium]
MENEGVKETSKEKEAVECPVCQLLGCLRKGLGPKSEFRRHLFRSKIEFLKAINSLIEERIQDLEKRAETPPKRAVKVTVE